MQNSAYILRGYSNSVLFYDEGIAAWTVELHSTDGTYASTNTTDYPFGEREWTVHGDPCFGEGDVVTTLNLNVCNQSEFNCANGQCVSMYQRCDGVLDCGDKTGADSIEHCSVKTILI